MATCRLGGDLDKELRGNEPASFLEFIPMPLFFCRLGGDLDKELFEALSAAAWEGADSWAPTTVAGAHSSRRRALGASLQ